MKDQFGREINYLRVSVTDRCNLRCTYCMGGEGIEDIGHEKILRNEELIAIIKSAANTGIRKVRITGGEPLVRKGIVELVRQIVAIDLIDEVVMTTNGILLNGFAEELKHAGVKRFNVSLDTLKPERYRAITRGGDIRAVLAGLEKVKALGFGPVKLNTVLIGGFNDDEIEDFVTLTQQELMEVRFIELMPVGEATHWAKERFIPSTTVLEKVPALEALEIKNYASPARYYKLPRGAGKVGLISPISCMFCKDCNRIRLTADGKIKNCLHSNEETDLRHALHSSAALEESIQKSVRTKPYAHRLGEGDFERLKRNMNQIGG